MKLIRNLSIITLVILTCTFLFSYVYAENRGSETYYTKVNIWYDKPNKIESTNYHKGVIIPFGTKVKNVNCVGNIIEFREEDTPGAKFKIFNIYKYSLIPAEDLLSRYFSSSDPKTDNGDFAGLSSQEKKNIEDGVIAEGMSKEAVIIAYGYPPKHRTPELTDNVWYYWYTRTIVDQVKFSNNKVVSIERTDSAKIFGK